MRIWIRTLLFSKFADLRLDWDTKEICGFAICITNSQICNLRTGTTQKYEDLQLQNEPKNLQICDLQINTKNLRALLCNL
jgi:hypothetical protein